MKDINRAFLAKWGWQLLCGSNSLWASLVKAKYLKGRCFLDVDDKRADSWFWKGIVECKELLLRGACKNIGSEVAIDVWEDPWVPTLPNFSPLPLQPQLQQPGLLGCDLFLETGGWDVSKLSREFEPSSVKAILKVPTSSSVSSSCWFWALATNGEFSVRSAYHANQRRRFWSYSELFSRSAWKKLWKAKIHPRHKILWSQIAMEALPIRSRLSRLFDIDTVLCPFCEEAME